MTRKGETVDETEVVAPKSRRRARDRIEAGRRDHRAADRRAAASSTSTAARSRSRRTWSTSSTRTASSSASSSYTDYAAEKVRTLCADRRTSFARDWADRGAARARSSRRSPSAASTSTQLAEEAGQPDADPFDLLCHLAFNAPLRTRRERAQRSQARAQGLLRPVRPRGAADPRRAAGQVRRARRRAVRAAGRASRCRRSRPHGNVERDRRASSAAPSSSRDAVDELQDLLYAA